MANPIDMSSEPKAPREISVAQAAVCQAHWGYTTFDEIELARIAEGVLTAESAKRIVRTYSVSRTLSLTSDLEGDTYERLAASVSDLAATAPAGLLSRAENCLAAAKRFDATRSPRSAFSKLLWFARPHGWMLFDSYAAKGAGVKASGEQAFMSFYTKLEKAGFEPCVAKLRAELSARDIPARLAERIIDWALMAAGGRNNPYDGPAWTQAYLTTRASDVAERLGDLATVIAPTLSLFMSDVQNHEGLPHG
ncbi:hypothetical protein ABI_25010 [Asticcacaulis biprosthecium C19]|uniref:Uncharacterized protein n=1 Tax=Asticcacaulis biprosthecium C19 TaxID=715226 RepID=F4QP30_9CAUL|nr:hypothetical protein [Asticcacaulis biprosthecium]EGF91088.1 hypothetical protein ABI_25010 [Asticcacaulis biprosthecium C19]